MQDQECPMSITREGEVSNDHQPMSFRERYKGDLRVHLNGTTQVHWCAGEERCKDECNVKAHGCRCSGFHMLWKQRWQTRANSRANQDKHVGVMELKVKVM